MASAARGEKSEYQLTHKRLEPLSRLSDPVQRYLIRTRYYIFHFYNFEFSVVFWRIRFDNSLCSRRSIIFGNMVVTNDHELPTYEELTVEEVPISSPGLRAAAHHIGNFLLIIITTILYLCLYHFWAWIINVFCAHTVFRKILPGCKRWVYDVQARN